tara:strand:- start:2464 stop:2973 length:510 start_codon:yes stop_codon:yes gene_type:complete
MLNDNLNDCPICLSEIIDYTTTNCGHSYCKTCIDNCLDNKLECPMCRQNIKYIKNSSETIRVVRYSNASTNNISNELFMHYYSRYNAFKLFNYISIIYILYTLYKMNSLYQQNSILNKKLNYCNNNIIVLENYINKYTFTNLKLENVKIIVNNIIRVCKMPLEYINMCI